MPPVPTIQRVPTRGLSIEERPSLSRIVHPEFLRTLADPLVVEGAKAISRDLRGAALQKGVGFAEVHAAVAKELPMHLESVPELPSSARLVAYPPVEVGGFVAVATNTSVRSVPTAEALRTLAPPRLAELYTHDRPVPIALTATAPVTADDVAKFYAAFNAIVNGKWNFTCYGSVEDTISPQGRAVVSAAFSIVASLGAAKLATAVASGPWYAVLIWGLFVLQASLVSAIMGKAAKDGHSAVLGFNLVTGITYTYEK